MAHPGYEHLLSPRETKRRQAKPHGQGARDQHQEKGDTNGRPEIRQHLGRGYQQSQHQEHDDLCEPSSGVVDGDNAGGRAQRPIAEDHAREIDREESAALKDRGQRIDNDGDRNRQQRMKSARQIDAVQKPRRAQTSQDAAKGANYRMQRQCSQECDGIRVRNDAVDGCQNDLGQNHRQKYSHRIVRGGLHFEGRADPLLHLQAVRMTPTLAKSVAGPMAPRSVLRCVRKPPSNKITASASEPIRYVER